MNEARRNALLRILAAALLGLAGVVLLSGADPTAAAPHRQSASDLIDAVNQLRASNGMAPLKVDPILMQVAQTQSDYNASTGELSHYGPSGLLTRDDAVAAGYGGGSTVFVSENIAVGTGLTPGRAVEMWTGDEPHLNTMLGQYYRDVGAGVGESDGSVYYTLVTGYVAGGYSANSTVPAAQSGVSSGVLFQPVITATPRPDGSIVHVVQEGQTLWTIAAVYGLDLAQLLSLNGLAEDSFVHPGDEVIVRPAATATPTDAPSATVAPSPPPATATLSAEQAAAATPDLVDQLREVDPRDVLAGACITTWVVIVIAGIVIAARRVW
jgi:LysM repeat protein